MSRPFRPVPLLLAAGLLGVPAALAAVVAIPHVTDVHIDPFYVRNAIADGCYCETHASCARMPASCVVTNDPGKAAGAFGMSEADCATPPALWDSALGFLEGLNSAAPFTVFTGDFGEAGLSAACSPSGPTARENIVANIAKAMDGVRSAFAGVPVYGVLGNHDTAPGDVFDGTAEMAWLYSSLLDSFGSSFAGDSPALASLLKGGWYSTLSPVAGLRIVALNTNYFTVLNPLLSNRTSAASLLGESQFAFLNASLAAAAARGERVLLLGHIPPEFWLAGLYDRFRAIVTPFSGVITAEVFGHNHVDMFELVRACSPPPPPAAVAPPPIDWIITRGIEWCSGGNLDVGDVFGEGLEGGDAWCPLLPPLDVDAKVQACESVCGNKTACMGFTWYPSSPPNGACCFRTNCASKPRDANSSAVCYEKPQPPPLCGNSSGPPTPIHVRFLGPSLTEGFPPSNPALRVLDLDTSTLEIVDVVTYSGNLTQANKEGAFVFEQEYTFTAQYGLANVSATSLAELVERMAQDSSAEWAAFWASSCKLYDGPSFEPCEDTCKLNQLALLNGSATA